MDRPGHRLAWTWTGLDWPGLVLAWTWHVLDFGTSRLALGPQYVFDLGTLWTSLHLDWSPIFFLVGNISLRLYIERDRTKRESERES